MKFKIFQPLLGVASRVLLLGLALLSPCNLYRRVCLSAASQALLFLTGDVAGFRHKGILHLRNHVPDRWYLFTPSR